MPVMTVTTKSGRHTWTGEPAAIVKAMSQLDHRCRDSNEYMENVRKRLATIGIDINFEIGNHQLFIEALSNEGLVHILDDIGCRPLLGDEGDK